MTKHPDLFAALAAPFDPSEVKIRSQGTRQLHYVTARTVMNRLDSIVGPENWWDRYVPGENSVLCELTIRLPDGTLLTKADAGGYAGMADQGDDDKSGYSDAFKRAAVKFGVARYLYRDGVPTYDHGDAPTPTPEPPQEAPRATPATNGHTNGTNGHVKQRDVWGGGKPVGAGAATTAPPASAGGDKVPRSGKAMFAWTREQEQRYSVGLLKYLNQWARLQEFPGRMVDWDADQVALAYTEACRKLASIHPENENQEVPE